MRCFSIEVSAYWQWHHWKDVGPAFQQLVESVVNCEPTSSEEAATLLKEFKRQGTVLMDQVQDSARVANERIRRDLE